MRTRILTAGVLALALSGPSHAREASESSRMDRFEQRLDEMEKKYLAEIRARDEEIARLRGMVEKATTEGRGEGVSGQGSGVVKQGTSAREEVLADIETRERARDAGRRIAATLNPDVAVITDFIGSISNKRGNDAYNRFDVREAELDFRAAVHPRADGVLILAIERDAENPLFPEEEEEGGGIDTSIAIEEGYLFLHDFGVPNLTAKIGRYHLRFGRQNMLHLHDLPTTDPSLVNQAFLSPEALTDAGVSLSYVVPNPWGQYVEVVAEVISGEGAGSESATLRGDFGADAPAVNLHALWNTDLNAEWNFELGASFLAGHADADNGQDVRLYGLDATLVRRDPRGRFDNQLVQSELIYGDVDQPGGDTQHALGAYLLFQQQLSRDWYAGVRFDWTENPNDDSEEVYGVAPYVSWYWTEFLRFRLQYEFLDGDAKDDEHVLFFQATWIFGAHPPHPYWAMK